MNKETIECNELKTIKYKTYAMNGNIVWPESKSSSNLENLDKYLENEKNKSVRILTRLIIVT